MNEDKDTASKLEPKLISVIKGKFYVPSYQRGYRWGEENVLQLLNDIWENGDNDYCLQPVVVKVQPNGDYELIDGQQRLTSLYLIQKYMTKLLPFITLNYSLSYQTRPQSEDFLVSLDEKLSHRYIDFFYIYQAYKTIERWFEDSLTGDKGLKAINLYKYFGEKVKVIWYEVAANENSTDLFTRLNIGKIALTNAELVKALFLSKDKDELSEEKQLEISTSWDTIERELHDENFWSFLTNEKSTNYATRIELLFNMMANKPLHNKELFYTFFYFNDKMKSENKVAIWKKIQEYFSLLKEWYVKPDIYHKVGYLVAVGYNIIDLINDSAKLTKSGFEKSLDARITTSLDMTVDTVTELSYVNVKNKPKIEKLLLLFNVETMRLLNNSFERYSFNAHKNNSWSLEHIHAQRSIGLNKKEEQQEWLRLHKASLLILKEKSFNKEKLESIINEIDENYENITKVIFDSLFGEVFALMSENDDRSYMDSITNMALLSSSDNSALNNSTFDVKRNKIIEMDKNGEYIPVCTRRVFLKYYTKSNAHQLHFWSDQDRTAYLDAIIGEKGIVTKYLTTKSED